jgi:hypothetical protein
VTTANPEIDTSLSLVEDIRTLIAGETVATGASALVVALLEILVEAARTKEHLAEGLGTVRALVSSANTDALWDPKNSKHH